MRTHFQALLLASAIYVCVAQPLSAQRGRRAITASANGADCAQPLAAPGPRCARYFPDSLKLTDAQKQGITRLRENFARDHAAQLQQLRSYNQYGQSAGQAGSSAARSGTMTAQGDSIRKSLRTAQKTLEQQVEATLTPGQRAFITANKPAKRGAGRRP